ncbi:MAG: ABC transporter permease [Tahibacter sp.]
MRLHVFELIRFSTYAELRAERARSYLGFIWWLAEPAMMMAAFWLVFGVILKSGGPDYVPFLLIGLVLWQWIKSCVTHGGHAIWSNLALIRQVRLPVLIFPLVQMLADTVKFLCIFSLLLVILWMFGYPPNRAYLALPLLFALIFLCAAGVGLLVAAVMPLLPDLRFVIEQVLTVLMFLSGVAFALKPVPPQLEGFVALNPVMVLLDACRDVLMRAIWPSPSALLPVAAMSVALALSGVVAVWRLRHRYPKLAI